MKLTKITLVLVTVIFLTGCQMVKKDTVTPEASSNVQSTKAETTGAVGINWAKAGPDAKTYQITFEQIEKAVKSGAKFYDVRSEEEYLAGNFGITENFPMAHLEAGKLPELDKDTPIYVHCLKGIRSAQAVKILREAGFTHVFDMGGVEHVEAVGGIIGQ